MRKRAPFWGKMPATEGAGSTGDFHIVGGFVLLMVLMAVGLYSVATIPDGGMRL
jgi:hypothetical protein